MALDSKIPAGPISDKWTNHKDHINLVNPAKYPADSDSWMAEAEKLFETTPLLNDATVMAQLQPYLRMGLLLTINGDEHHIPRVDAVPGRFDQIMDLFGEWVDGRLETFGVNPDMLVNTWPVDRLLRWLNR